MIKTVSLLCAAALVVASGRAAFGQERVPIRR